MPAPNILLVEGVSDQYFFSELLRFIAVSAEVRVTSPKDHGGYYNNKGGVYTTLRILAKQLNDGRLDRVAAVVDADHDGNNGMGYAKTVDLFSDMLNGEGFERRHRVGEGGGFNFEHKDGLNPVGLWIMPDNESNGGIEELVLQSAIASEIDAITYAERILAKVPNGPKYSEYHVSKAKAACWMSWQVAPGQGLQQAVREKLIDFNNPSILSLIAWLRTTFP